MTEPLFDERGWTSGIVEAVDPDDAVALFLPVAALRLHSFELMNAARSLGFALTISPEKHYPSGTIPLADLAVFELRAVTEGSDSMRARVRVVPRERASRVVDAALDTALLAGGQGMDGLVKRSRLVVQIDDATSDACALLVAALFARAHLGPIRLPNRVGEPPHIGLFGLKGARERLAAYGVNVE